MLAKQLKMKKKRQKDGFLGMLLGTWGASLSRNKQVKTLFEHVMKQLEQGRIFNVVVSINWVWSTKVLSTWT